MIPSLSIYFYLFNARLRDFDLEGCIANFCDFSDEVVCATIKSQDDTLERLKEQEILRNGKFKVIFSDIDPTKDNRWDGKLKTVALNACSKSTSNNPRVYIIADADEVFLLKQRSLWDKAAVTLVQFNHLDGWLIPVIDLYGDKNHIRDSDIGQKFRIHKNTVVARGVVPSAELANGKFRTDLSDNTEPLNSFGELASFASYIRQDMLSPQFTSSLNGCPFVIHNGFLDLQRKAKIGKEFWKSRWEEYSGHEENVATEVNELSVVKTVKHRLDLT